MNHDIAALRQRLATEGPMQTWLTPEDVEELEEAGFLVAVDWTATINEHGQLPCTVSVNPA